MPLSQQGTGGGHIRSLERPHFHTGHVGILRHGARLPQLHFRDKPPGPGPNQRSFPSRRFLVRPGCAHHRPLGGAPYRTTLARWATVRDAGYPRRPPRPSPDRAAGSPGLPATAMPRRNRPPRSHVHDPPTAPTPIRRPASRTSTSPPARNCPPQTSATSPPCAGLHSGESVLLHGHVGVGKTPDAQALGQVAIRQGAEVRFYKTSRALTHLAGGHATALNPPP